MDFSLSNAGHLLRWLCICNRLLCGQFRVYLCGTYEQDVRPAFNRPKSEALRFEGRPIISILRVCRLDKLEIVR